MAPPSPLNHQPSSSFSFAALIPAAGSGTRLGHGPKAAVTVGGRSLLAWAVAALAPHVSEVVVALPEGLALPDDVPAGVRTITGGATRQDSVRLLLDATGAEYVLIHDAARPFLSADIVQAVQAAVQRSEAATVALPVADSLVRGGEAAPGGPAFWAEGVPREDLWAVQTPQGFRRELLQAAHAGATAAGFSATDDAGLVARLGHPVELVPGDARLLKVTRGGDLALAEALAASLLLEKEGADHA
ncbi:2-C-methyl-D-erythritol 4-phosphate cytidylyltransferase [Deinococcus sp. Marseille-Q6407]|uniref:2-C-methyl-D-erythritol 4-phosphate cytidylyltransferase n=1 Tax=Deinococcus sp. Marseille-Q6407 TaxID=2969223 RepID=UPI0021C1EDB6|nr:2-C-methyl-D-erythritol 4-phosphate cytidylyltransferase [Deinococcus sp. Marseille-Q6407]